MKTRIYLIDDHRILREGVAALIDQQPGLTVVGHADNGHDGLTGVDKTSPDLVILDISMPSLNGIEVTRRMQKSHPNTKVLVLSMHADRRFIAGAVSAGASGYLLKETASEELLRAIETISGGQIYLSPAVASVMVAEFRGKAEPGTAAPTSNLNTLTQREREVLQLLAEGNTAKEIASKLGLSVKTAESHRGHLMTKLRLKSITELIKYALREGVIAL